MNVERYGPRAHVQPPGPRVPARAFVRAALAVAACVLPGLAPGQGTPTMLFEGATTDAVSNALHERCYDAGMTVELVEGGMIVCSASLTGNERLLDDVVVASVHEGRARHLIRFALAPRTDGVRVWAYPWIEIEEADGVVLEDEIRSDGYLARVQTVLARVGEALRDDGAAAAEPWTEHYETEHAWRLDAHLRSVEYCDNGLDDLDPERVDGMLERAGVQPMSQELRGRCEELYEPVFRWGLARGIEEPTVEGYAEYRDALPPAQRCTGQLALDATTCR